MKRILRKMSLKRRLWVSFVFLTVVCISVTGTYVSVFFSNQMKAQAAKTSQDTLNKTAQVFDERLRNIVVSISTLMMGESFQETMRDVQANNKQDYFKRLSQLQTPFAQMMMTEQSIDSVLIHTPIGDFYPTENRRSTTSFEETYINEMIVNAQTRWSTLWIRGHEEELFRRGNPVISLVIKPLFERTLPNVYVVVNIQEERLLELIHAHLQEGSLRQLIMDRSSMPVFSSVPVSTDNSKSLQEAIGDSSTGHFEYVADSGLPFLVNYAALDMNADWMLVGYQSKSDLLAPVRHMRWTIVTIMGVCVVLALIMSSMLSELLLKPLFKLRNLMLKVETNHLDVKFESVFEDEISQVGYKFNRMLEQIKELIEEVRSTEQEKRKSEIKALQAQIDPHFLYNTLNTIYWKSEMQEQQAVSGMIVSLSQLFRLGLNNGHEITTLRQELEHVSQYLSLQSMCYPDLFYYEIAEVDEKLLDVPILKILLQPLVENSILHGFQELPHQGRIRIETSAQDGMLTISVNDNGVGMDVHQVQQMLSRRGKECSSYALSNVRARLALYYGSKASFILESESCVRTSVRLVIPIREVIEE
ncbi:two-component system sensor histidine kinase YesM [Paenibacillus phyllosphaerae]|uniref:Two-component system sensor histidine kinase YesM n=1 Tax=Paenibacillus phyllosphaerae TaxID=274593 RepID=A0A7W5FRE6_9BACL|nr:sensor histidine kinase [Paenibacillus phyllosphaerae]MBB3114445.1 two-component system sensor histidine kinase YesM [Paenibacillus phyllosphaerae]